MTVIHGPNGPMRDPTPVYYRIFQTLRRRIAADTYPVGGQLPTEDELMREFSVSRHTIRAAVQQLVVQGLVRRHAGKGTFVLDPATEGTQWGAQSLDDMVDRPSGHRIDALTRVVLEAGTAEEREARRRLGTEDRVVRFSWLRRSTAGPASYAVVYVAHALADSLPLDWTERLQTRRLLHLVEEHADVEAFRVRQVSSAVAADADAAERLEVPLGAPLLSLERSYLDREGGVIELSRILARPDRYEQTVELYRVGR